MGWNVMVSNRLFVCVMFNAGSPCNAVWWLSLDGCCEKSRVDSSRMKLVERNCIATSSSCRHERSHTANPTSES